MLVQYFNGSSNIIFNTINNDGVAIGYTVYLTGTVNWGMAPSTRITQRGPFQDGDTDIDFRLNPRVFSLPIVIEANSIDEHMNARNMLMKIFKPSNNQAANLQVRWDNETERRNIYVKVVGGLTMDTDARDFNVRTVIQMRADDPSWFEDITNEQQLSATVLGTPTPYSKPYPVPYGSSGVNNINYTYYEGTWITRPILICDGPLTNLTLTDTKGHIIRFAETIPDGSRVVIDLKTGNPLVTLNDGLNGFYMLAIESDLMNWAIYPSPDDEDGQGLNVISISATGSTSASMVTMTYFNRYIGV